MTTNNKIIAPFTKEQVEGLKMYQNNLSAHPFTCGSPENIPECFRRNDPMNEGELIPTEKGWICPCGKYTQNWAHSFMLDMPGGYMVE